MLCSNGTFPPNFYNSTLPSYIHSPSHVYAATSPLTSLHETFQALSCPMLLQDHIRILPPHPHTHYRTFFTHVSFLRVLYGPSDANTISRAHVPLPLLLALSRFPTTIFPSFALSKAISTSSVHPGAPTAYRTHIPPSAPADLLELLQKEHLLPPYTV